MGNSSQIPNIQLDQQVLYHYLNEQDDQKCQEKLNKQKNDIRNNKELNNFGDCLFYILNFDFRYQIYKKTEVDQIVKIMNGWQSYSFTQLFTVTLSTALYYDKLMKNRIFKLSNRKNMQYFLCTFMNLSWIYLNSILMEYRVNKTLYNIMERITYEQTKDIFYTEFDTQWKYSIDKYNMMYKRQIDY